MPFPAPRSPRRLARGAAGAMLPEGVDRRGIVVLATGHFAADFFQGMVPSLMPFLVSERHYSYAQVGVLVLAASLGSAILQPVLGAVADRIHGTWMVPGGLLLAAAGMAATALVTAYPATLAALMLGGFGVAAFHPEAIRFANHASGSRQGAGMSFFAVGGSAGFMTGPIVTSIAVIALGLHGLLVVALVELVLALLVFSQVGYLGRFREGGPRRRVADAPPSDWFRFGVVAATATVRACTSTAVQAFVPLYLVTELGAPEGKANLIISTYFAANVVGSVLGGHLADRIGFTRVVTLSLLAAVPLLAPVPVVGIPAIFACVAGYGLVNGMNFYPLVVVAQRAIPAHAGLAAGVTLGMSIGLGSALVALLGVLADAAGLTAVLWALVGGTVLAGVFAVVLALTGKRPRRATVVTVG